MTKNFINFFKSLTKPIYTQPRLVPALFSLLILGLILFSTQKLSKNITEHLIPALIVYCLGAALIQTIHRLLAINYENPIKSHENESTIPRWLLIIIYSSHIILFILFTKYLFLKNIL